MGGGRELKRVVDCAKVDDRNSLIRALKGLKDAGKICQLNSRLYNSLTPLEIAARHGYVCNARLLIAYGAANALRSNQDFGLTGMSALYHAAVKGQKKTVKFLLEKEAAPNLNPTLPIVV